MEVVLRFFVDFWPVLLLVLLRPALGLLTATSFAAVRASVDRAFPKDLPQNTGDWLRRQLRLRGMEGQVDVLTSTSDQATVDAYFPGSSFIQLAPDTWLRTDPVGWATAAHELGHAINYRRGWALHSLLVFARWSSRGTWTLACAFILANLLHGSVLVAQLAYALLIVASLTHALVLWDELWASQIGMSLLREDGRMDARRLDGAHVTMGAAFLSYASGLVGTVAVLLAYPAVAQLTVDRDVFVEGAPLDGVSLGIAAGLSAALTIRAATEIWRLLRPPRYESAGEAEVALTLHSLLDTGWAVPLIALLALVWNQPLGTVFTVAFVLAVLPGLQALLRILAPVLPLLMLPLFLMLMPLIAWAVPRCPPHQACAPPGEEVLAQVRAEMERGHYELREAQLRLVNDPPLYMRLSGLARVSYVPLLALYWLLS